jgi:hypothetical protein
LSLEQINGGEFRFYRYDAGDGSEPVDLLSVTSIRQLCGEGYQLVAWKMANLADAALGTMKRTVVGPRGGIKEVRQVWEYPSEFAQQYAASNGEQAKIDALRKWLREQADEPRNIAAMRGTIVHEAIEKNVAWDRIERPYVESAFANLSASDRKRAKRVVNEEDIAFIRNSVRHYWAMRGELPVRILAREVRVVNLAAGYAGTFDALVWLLGLYDGNGVFVPLAPDKMMEAMAMDTSRVTVADIGRIGGAILLLDWKTSKGIHTDHVTQAHAYLAAEFAVVDDQRDERVTALLNAAYAGGLVHIRPSGWGVYLFEWKDEAIRAFLGSVAFARYLAKYPKPDAIFGRVITGASNETDEEVDGGD